MRSATLTASIGLLATAALAQAPDSLVFEVASVKPSPPLPPQGGVYLGPARGGPGTADPGQITWTYARFMDLLTTAYDVKTYQISGPAWLNTERYDIHLKLPANVTPANVTKDQVGIMWRNLLAERFGVKLHHESREFQVEELLLAKGGHKLKESAEDPTPPLSGDPPKFSNGVLHSPGFVLTIFPGASRADVHAISRAQPLSKLTAMLGNLDNRPVLDKTGLTGNYDFALEFTMDMSRLTPSPPPVDVESATDPGSDVGSALQEQLGLRLMAGKAKLDVLIIDNANKVPTEN